MRNAVLTKYWQIKWEQYLRIRDAGPDLEFLVLYSTAGSRVPTVIKQYTVICF